MKIAANGVVFAAVMQTIPEHVSTLMKKIRGKCHNVWPPFSGTAEDICCEQVLQVLRDKILAKIGELAEGMSEEQRGRAAAAISEAGREGLDAWKRIAGPQSIE